MDHQGEFEQHDPSQDGIPYGYWQLTRTATYSYLFVLPLIILYEIGVRIVNKGEFGVRVGADVLIKHCLDWIGLHETLWASLLLTLIGVVILILERKKMIPIILRYFGAMMLECSAYAVAIGFLIGTLLQKLFAIVPPMMQQGVTGPVNSKVQDAVLSLGAGVYEELVFRLILVTGLFWIFRLFFTRPTGAYIIAALLGAIVFSWAHYIGSMGDVFSWYSFTFRFLMGLSFNVLLLKRGFGVAAMTHALYDVFVTLFMQ